MDVFRVLEGLKYFSVDKVWFSMKCKTAYLSERSLHVCIVLNEFTPLDLYYSFFPKSLFIRQHSSERFLKPTPPYACVSTSQKP
jgi:hypothetical protein